MPNPLVARAAIARAWVATILPWSTTAVLLAAAVRTATLNMTHSCLAWEQDSVIRETAMINGNVESKAAITARIAGANDREE